MTEQVEAGEEDYLIPGDIWAEEEHFQTSDTDKIFYLDKSDRLVVIFDEYEAVAGSVCGVGEKVPSITTCGYPVEKGTNLLEGEIHRYC